MEIPMILLSMKINILIFELLIFQVLAESVKSVQPKMVEAPQYNPLFDIRVHGNSIDTSKYENQHVNFWLIFEILIFQVLAHSVKIVQTKVAKMGKPLSITPWSI